ncbi:MAG: hypothetical protein ACYS80_06730 [Planctomycetota bacterium]|jgi:hypothetical protein
MKSQRCTALRVYFAILILIPAVSKVAHAQEPTSESEGPFTYLFDTGTSSSAPLSGDNITKRTNWTKLPEDKTAHEFKGDVVFLNNKLVVILRQGISGAEIYSRRGNDLETRGMLIPIAEGQPGRLSSVEIIENNTSNVAIDAAFKVTDGQILILRYKLRIGQTFIETESRQGVKRLRAEAPCRFAVLPDFFADDIVIDAGHIPVSKAELPSENFIMHLLNEGQAILVGVWDKRDQDVQITLSGQDSKRIINNSEIQYGKDGKIWIAIMEDEGIWYMRDIEKKDVNKEISLPWRHPFPAQWRVDWRKVEGQTDSWEMISQKPDGEYVKHGWFGQPESLGTPDWMSKRQRWTTVLGWFRYPCWVDKNGRGYLQPLKSRGRPANRPYFQGPAIIYPINRLKDTPIDKFTVVDIVRETLGVGPCEYILDVEGQQKEFQGIATCAARDILNDIYKKKQQKQRRAEVEKALVDVLAFVQHIRGRIEDYVVFGREMRMYLAEQKKAYPELLEPLTEMETLTSRIDEYLANRKASIKTPGYPVKLVKDFQTTLVDYEGDDALTRCKKITAGLVEIGGNQDELVGECRMAVKVLRQRAGLIMATDPRMANIAREIRRRTQEMLRNPVSYEAPRH